MIIGSHIPFALLGIAIGLAAFAVLMAALYPVLRGTSAPSLPKGILSVLVSFAMVSAGVAAVYLMREDELIVFLAGELLSLFACWTALAVYTIRCGRRS